MKIEARIKKLEEKLNVNEEMVESIFVVSDCNGKELFKHVIKYPKFKNKRK